MINHKEEIKETEKLLSQLVIAFCEDDYFSMEILTTRLQDRHKRGLLLEQDLESIAPLFQIDLDDYKAV